MKTFYARAGDDKPLIEERHAAASLKGKRITNIQIGGKEIGGPDLVIMFEGGAQLEIEATGHDSEGVYCKIT